MMVSDYVERVGFSRGPQSWGFYWRYHTEKTVWWSSCS